MSFIDLIGTVANILSFVVFITPVKCLYEGILIMEIKSLEIEFFIIAIIMSSFWLVFGHKVDDFYVYFINDVCAVLFTIYLLIFLYIRRKNTQMILYLVGLLLIVFLLWLTLVVF